jgi:hypothetical protein
VLANIPATQTVIEIREPGGPEVLVPAIRPVPEPKAGEVLIRIAAAGLNRADCLQRMGRYPMPPGHRTSRGSNARAPSSDWARACRNGVKAIRSAP